MFDYLVGMPKYSEEYAPKIVDPFESRLMVDE